MQGRRKWLLLLPLLFLVVVVWGLVRRSMMPGPPKVTAVMKAQAKRVKIIRDKWGVPHIFGKSDADTAFGLAYAHAEDDFPLIQLVLAASIGRLSLLRLSGRAIGNDFYVRLIRVNEQVEKLYPKLSPATRKLLEGYANGLNYYAALHPKEVDGRMFPVSGKTLAAGFVHKVPLMFQLPKVMVALRNAKQKKVGQPVFASKRTLTSHTRLAQFQSPYAGAGSNAHAVHRKQSTDDVTRLNINSHQPWEGPVAWYEAQLHSEEGWNMTGGLFPGSPVILHGHNDHLGWAMTVNNPDLVDVYKLVMHPKKPFMYKLDGKWKKLEKRRVSIPIDLKLFTFPLKMDMFHSVHGPVLKTSHGYYAIRYAGMNKAIFTVEQWYRMNKAKDFSGWKKAMRMHSFPMFNLVYADRDNIFYVYNARLPKRKPGFDYKTILPGDRSDLIWKTVVPWDKLPQVYNPRMGFVQNCNATPFLATKGPGNPNRASFQKEAGIEQRNNSRSSRSRLFLSMKGKISHKDFLRMKFDLSYDPYSPIIQDNLVPLLKSFKPENKLEQKGLALLKKWNLSTQKDNRHATLFVLTYHAMRRRGLFSKEKARDLPTAFRQALHFLVTHYGRLDVPLGKVQRLRRGKVDLGISGGPDILRAVHSRLVGSKLVGRQGDSYILIAEFTAKGVRSHSRHQYGNVNRKNSKHYNDQAKPFIQDKLKKVVRDKATLLKEAEAVYHPGEETASKP